MSVVFGLMHSDDQVVDEKRLVALGQSTIRFADGETLVRCEASVGMGFQAYQTHERSRLESGPAIGRHGNLVVLDGRLDNYMELSDLLGLQGGSDSDSVIVLEAFLRWGDRCFAKLLGDWALALWSSRDRSLYLARDHAGTRSLYYRWDNVTCLWSTYLETFFAGDSLPLEREYLARYVGFRTIGNLTPYRNIVSVPPAHYVVMRASEVKVEPHWKWMIKGSLRHSCDEEYESQFLSLFSQSIERRTGAGAPILAHLSGGMDSTGIVCVSDHLRETADERTELLDTVSFFDDSEPNWNERPFFSLVEARRGKTGIHISTATMDRSFDLPDPSHSPLVLPGFDKSIIAADEDFQRAIRSGGYKTILSGIGGDELLGGVPTPLPELADYLVAMKCRRLLSKTLEWCKAGRTPYLHMLMRTVGFAIEAYRPERLDPGRVPPWLVMDSRIDYREQETFGRLRHFSPTSINNGRAWWQIMETLPHLTPSISVRREYRYPYLDRDLVEYLFQVPREQLTRPGTRRSLMRRALKDIVPTEILHRRRKAFLIRGPLALIRRERRQFNSLFENSIAASLGIIDPLKLSFALDEVAAGNNPRWWPSILRTAAIEVWLKSSKCYS